MFTDARYAVEDETMIRATRDDQEYFIPNDFANRMRRELQEWIDLDPANNVIGPYVP